MIRVLLVEDDPMVAELNRLYVNKVEGFETVAAVRDGAAALEALRHGPVDLILLDIFMPGASGLDLLTRIRGMEQDVDVIFVTAARDTRTIGRALKLGAVDYLIKPFEFERMQQALEHYRATHRLLREEHPASQEELDKVFIRQAAEAAGGDSLPKGLDRARLDKVWQAIQALGEGAFTSEDVAARVGISRVSARKYLEFLCGIKVLGMEPSCGTVGRPVHQYTLQKAQVDALRRFL